MRETKQQWVWGNAPDPHEQAKQASQVALGARLPLYMGARGPGAKPLLYTRKSVSSKCPALFSVIWSQWPDACSCTTPGDPPRVRPASSAHRRRFRRRYVTRIAARCAVMPANLTTLVENEAAIGAPDEHQTKGISFEFALLPPPTGAAIGGATSLGSLQAAAITADLSATFAVQEGSSKYNFFPEYNLNFLSKTAVHSWTQAQVLVNFFVLLSSQPRGQTLRTKGGAIFTSSSSTTSSWTRSSSFEGQQVQNKFLGCISQLE